MKTTLESYLSLRELGGCVMTKHEEKDNAHHVSAGTRRKEKVIRGKPYNYDA